MFNRSRKILCPECGAANFWQGEPQPTDELHCHACQAFVSTYDGYIYGLVRHEAERMLAQYLKSEAKSKQRPAMSWPKNG